MPGLFDDELTEVLLRPINSRRVGQKEGQSHVEAYDIRAHLIRMFGFGGFDEVELRPAELLYEQPTETKAGRPAFKVAYRASRRLTVRVLDRNGTEQSCTYTGTAVGESIMPDYKRGDAHDMAIKTAESQALKRCAINLGDQFGLSLYNKGSKGALVMRVVGHTPPAGNRPDVEVDANIPDIVAVDEPEDQDDEPDVQPPPLDPEPEPEPQLELDEVPVEVLPAEPDDPPPDAVRVTDAQIRKMQVCFGELGVKDRDAKLRHISRLAGRTVTSSKKLTLDEAKVVINGIEDMIAEMKA